MASIAPPAHTRSTATTDDWITPRWLVDRLGPFDLDPCESETQPWPCARRTISPATGHGLMMGWEGEVWCNPPYGKETSRWLHRLAGHGNGVALVFARTDTRMFFRDVWPRAVGILFLRGRLTFCYPDGSEPRKGHNSGGPSVLIGYGEPGWERIRRVEDLGRLVRLT